MISSILSVGTIGHVAHGKSTVVKAISGVHTVRFKNELERNITIKLGYANAKVSCVYCGTGNNFVEHAGSTFESSFSLELLDL